MRIFKCLYFSNYLIWLLQIANLTIMSLDRRAFDGILGNMEIGAGVFSFRTDSKSVMLAEWSSIKYGLTGGCESNYLGKYILTIN